MKTCTNCGVSKELSEFHKKQSKCKPCRKVIDRKYYENDRNNYYFRTYGITLANYDAMYHEQEGCCAICGVHQLDIKRRFCVDHCHITGQVRGLLCHSCNVGIGKLQDNYDIIERAADYLRSSEGRL